MPFRALSRHGDNVLNTYERIVTIHDGIDAGCGKLLMWTCGM